MQTEHSRSRSTLSLPHITVTPYTSSTHSDGACSEKYMQAKLETHSMTSSDKSSQNVAIVNNANIRGWLQKWTNYIKGYQRRWFVLNQGILSYYRSQAEMKYTCRGTIYMRNAILITLDTYHFVIKNGSTTIHLKAATEAEKQKWIAALELARSAKLQSNAYDDNNDSIGEVNLATVDFTTNDKKLQQKLEELEACFDLMKKQQHAIQKCIRCVDNQDKTSFKNLLSSLDERTTIFRITATSLINNCRAFLTTASDQRKTVTNAYLEERELRMRLEDVVQKLAKQQNMLEKNLMRSNKGAGHSMKSGGGAVYDPHLVSGTSAGIGTGAKLSAETDDDDIFHDALDQDLLRMPLAPIMAEKIDNLADDNEHDAARFQYEYESSSDEDEDEFGEDKDKKIAAPSILIRMAHSLVDDKNKTDTEIQDKGFGSSTTKRQRRKSIPSKPDYSLNLWSIIKNSIGKDLTKIPVPVNFSEPLSMLQRLTEELEYSEILDQAAQCEDSCKQMAYVAAFTISVYSTTADRAAKPFNPLLGETFECDRTEDLGWRSISEQVSHHPPSLANYAKGKTWNLWQEFTMTSKFRGQYLSITPLGYSHLIFPKTGHHYTWKKVTTCVQNIILGKLWIDNVGEMDIVNHVTKDRCHIKFYEYSMFSKDDPRKVAGIITDGVKVARWIINGKWNDFIEAAEVKNPGFITSKSRFETHNPILLWRRRYPPDEHLPLTNVNPSLNDMVFLQT
ncbi:hypothetical protein GJ496_010827 [Pomphorhynchus laevis]|nr:hypothetical protein GJ496_010827 [Pomphorhynchus laevis]